MTPPTYTERDRLEHVAEHFGLGGKRVATIAPVDGALIEKGLVLPQERIEGVWPFRRVVLRLHATETGFGVLAEHAPRSSVEAGAGLGGGASWGARREDPAPARRELAAGPSPSPGARPAR